MEPRLFLKWLLARHGENTNSLAKKLKGNPSQSQIFRFLSGDTKEPNRAMLETLADHFSISVDALYDFDKAAEEKAQIEQLGTQNKPLTVIKNTQEDNDEMQLLKQTLDYFLSRLEHIEPADQEPVTAILAALVRNPANAKMRTALEAILTTETFTQQSRKAA